MPDRGIGRLRVLVVDDNPHMITIIKVVLREFGVQEIFDARTGDEAYGIFKSSRIDLVLTDYAMKPMDGFAFTRMVRTADDSPNPLVPIIMLTAYSERSVVEKAREAGVNEFCSKPVAMTELHSKLRAVINHPRRFVRMGAFFGPDRRRRKYETMEYDRRIANAAHAVAGR